MIYVFDNGESYSDHVVHFVEYNGPEPPDEVIAFVAEAGKLDAGKPWQCLLTAPEVAWYEGNPSSLADALWHLLRLPTRRLRVAGLGGGLEADDLARRWPSLMSACLAGWRVAKWPSDEDRQNFERWDQIVGLAWRPG